MTRLGHVVAAVYDRPWFIRSDVLRQIGMILQRHVAGGQLSQEEMESRLAAAAARNGPRGGARVEGAVGVIPVYGTIFPRANLMTEMSGGATVDGIRMAFREALADESIGSILFDFDSPGGMVDGIEELATEIRDARGRKPMVSIANYGMASAALYLGAQADEVVASPSSAIGWVGTAMVHQEYSKADEMEGITTTIFRNPPGKLGGNPYEPLLEQTRTEFKAMTDEFTGMFNDAMAKGRGVPVAKVQEDFGQGGGMLASKALAAGLVDRIETFDSTVRRLATGRGPAPRGARAYGPYRIEADSGNSTGTWAIEGLAVDEEPSTDPPLVESDVEPAAEVDEVALERAIASRRRR